MLGHKRCREEEKSDDNSLSNKTTAVEKKNFNANFLMKLYQILETPELNGIIEWGENGKFFKVKNITGFTEKVLPKFFKHNNFASFVRQLNMYDFHKKRTYNNENVFQHKSFTRGQKNLIKTIKRKNTNNSLPNENNKADGEDFIENHQRELSSKKLTKQNLEKIILNYTKHFEIWNERQKNLEMKYEQLEKKCDEYNIQNRNLMHEISSRSEWTKKLEAIIFLIFDCMKSKIIKNESAQARSAILSANKEANYISQYSDKKEYKPSKAQTDPCRINSNVYRNYNENAYESVILKNLVDNLFDYIADNNSIDKPFINKNDIYPMLAEKEKFLALENIDYTKLNLLNNTEKSKNNFSINENCEIPTTSYISSNLKDESLNKILNKASYTNNNNNYFNENNSKSFYNENGTEIFKIENDPNRKNIGLGLGLGLGYSYQENNLTAKNNYKNLNNGKSKAKQTITNSKDTDLGVNYNFNDLGVNQITPNELPKPNSTIKNFKISIEDQIINNDSLIGNIMNPIDIKNNNTNFNYLGLKEELKKKDEMNLSLNGEDKSIFLKTFKSPNPFEDYSFGQNSNLFNSPNPMESIMYKPSSDVNEKINFNLDLSRNSTLDYNDIFKSTAGAEHLEEKKLPKENNLFFDDSFFSISSNEKKSEAVSEPICNSRGLGEAEVLFSSRSLI